VDLEALLRGGEIGSDDEMSEWLDEDEPVILLDDGDDLDPPDQDNRLVFEMRRGIGRMIKQRYNINANISAISSNSHVIKKVVMIWNTMSSLSEMSKQSCT